jgi:hypothetical protein
MFYNIYGCSLAFPFIQVNEDSDRTRQPATDGELRTNGVLTTDAMESLRKELERQSSQINSLASSLNELQFWVVGALQRETGEVHV